MQEKDIKSKLNQELEEMAPDILNKILAQPIEPIKSEKELFGKDRPLFKEKKKISKFIYAPAMTAVAACLIMVMFLLNPSTPTESVSAFSIVIDVNPSISIDVNEDGTVKKVIAENKDAKKIVKEINEDLEQDDSYNKVVRKLIKELDKEGYLKKKDKAMLISVVAEDKNLGKTKVSEVKEKTEKFTKKNDINCKPVYQNCVVTEEVKKVAKKNHVSVGKAAFCIKIASKRKDVKADDICNETIDDLVTKAEDSGIAVENIVLEVEVETEIESTSEEISGESVSVNESESMSVSGEIYTDINGQTLVPESTSDDGIEETLEYESHTTTGTENPVVY